MLPRLEKKNLANDSKNVTPSFFRRNKFLDLVGKENQPDFVVVAYSGEGQDAGDFGGQFAFGLLAGAEEARAGEIDNQHDCELAFLDKLLDERMIHPRGDIPIDRADFVAGLIFADL